MMDNELINREYALQFLNDCKELSLPDLMEKYKFITNYKKKEKVVDLLCSIMDLNRKDYIKRKLSNRNISRSIVNNKNIAILFMKDLDILSRDEMRDKYDISSNTTLYRIRDKILDTYKL